MTHLRQILFHHAKRMMTMFTSPSALCALIHHEISAITLQRGHRLFTISDGLGVRGFRSAGLRRRDFSFVGNLVTVARGGWIDARRL